MQTFRIILHQRKPTYEKSSSTSACADYVQDEFKTVTNTLQYDGIRSHSKGVPKFCTCLYVRHQLEVCYMLVMYTLTYVTCTRLT